MKKRAILLQVTFQPEKPKTKTASQQACGRAT